MKDLKGLKVIEHNLKSDDDIESFCEYLDSVYGSNGWVCGEDKIVYEEGYGKDFEDVVENILKDLK